MVTRTPEEMHARRAATLAAQPPTPPLVLVAGDPKRMEKVKQAAELLFEGEGDLAVLRVTLWMAKIPVAATTDLWDFIKGLERFGYRREPVAFAEPVPGSLYVTCGTDHEPNGIGIVAKVDKDKETGLVVRDRFFRATAEEVKTSEVEFWLLSPQGCVPCAERKRPANG